AWTPEMCFKIKKVGDVQPSPDGKRVVYTVTETVFAGGGATEPARVYVANADGTVATPLTDGTGQPGGPQWSADGAGGAYLAGGDLHRVRPDGTGGEPLTRGRAVISFKWSPDGAALAFLESDRPAVAPPGPGLVVDEDIFLGPSPRHDRLRLVAAAKDAKG